MPHFSGGTTHAMPAPARPKIYHITHMDNLPTIIGQGGLFSDARMIAAGGPVTAIGMASIKARRLDLRCAAIRAIRSASMSRSIFVLDR